MSWKSWIQWSIALVISGHLLPALGQDIRISEFLASNVTDFPEMYDFGDYNDWIELHNSSASSLDLSNYFLSDNANQPLKWKLPEGTLVAPEEYLIIWADGYNIGPGHRFLRPTWPWDSYDTRHYHSNFKLSQNAEDLLLSQADPGSPVALIEAGAIWKYLDNGTDQGMAWSDPNFDDQVWSQGAAQLGYGDGDETTLLSFGPTPNQKYITSYFRHWFEVEDATAFQYLTLGLQRDDGAVIYLNGAEILRANMPEGSIDYQTLASTAVSSTDEDTFFEFSLPAENLVSGSNLLAVEIHQISGSSSDISFDLELSALGYANVVLIDQFSYGSQVTDVSQGRTEAGSLQFFGEPTPGAPNLTPATLNTESTTSVSSSLPSGFYSGSQQLILSTSDPDAAIHYTLDGSKPGSSSPLYAAPLLLETTTVLRARAFAPGKLPGDLLTLSYLINAPNDLTTISLVTEPRLLWDPDLGIYANEYKQREIPVRLEYFSSDMVHQFSINAGSRLGGLNIWTKPQKPFTIYTRNRFGDDFIHHQLFPSKPISEFSRIVLRNGGDDWEETLIRDPMTESLVQGMMAAGYMAYAPCALFLNGEYWGIYNIREKFDSQYFFENFGADPNNIDHLEYTATQSGTQLMVIAGDLASYDALLNFIQTQDLNDPESYAQVQQMMNIDGFIDHLVMTLYSANTSWGHNREWWRSREDGSQWQWLIVDVDRSFNPDNTNINLVDDLMDSYLLFQYLLPCQAFRDRFVQRAAAHLNNTFRYERMAAIVDSLSANIATEMPRHIERWGSSGSISSMLYWEGQLNEIKQFAQARAQIVRNQLENEFDLEGTVALALNTEPAGSGKVFVNEVPILGASTTAPYFKNSPLMLRAQPAPGYQFSGWIGNSDSAQIQVISASDTAFTALFQPSGEILLPPVLDADLMLSGSNSYILAQDLRVPAGITLILNAGVELRMPAGGNIIVEGRMQALGTEAAPVRIISNLATGNARWGAISFHSQTDTSRLQYIEIRGATRGADPLHDRGAISSNGSHLLLDHVDLRQVDFPIFIQRGSALIQSCSIRSEAICDFINVKRASIVLDDCHFFGSHTNDTDAIDFDGITDGLISNNRIYNFSGFNSDGIDIGEDSHDLVISGNLIYHVFDKGISVGQRSTVLIERNLIVGCAKAVAVKDSSSALLINNTFFRNDTSVACYVKNAGAGGGAAEVVNTIFSESRSSPLFADGESNIAVRYSLADTEALPGMSNLFGDPLFLSPHSYNLELNPSSPCIDSGDPSLPDDTDGSRSDLGAYYHYDAQDFPFDIPAEYEMQLVINEFLASNQSTVSDENGDFDDWLEFFNPSESSLDLAGMYLTDNPDNLTKWTLPASSAMIEPGGHLLIWCDEDAAQGALHANFKLSASGEYLALVAANGTTIIDSISFGPQLTDVSFGRSPDGASTWSSMTPTPGSSNIALATSEARPLPSRFRLSHNFPNPFNSSTTIRFELPRASRVSIRIINLRGQVVRTLVDADLPAGYGELRWNGDDEAGVELAAGIYILTMTAEDFRQTQKLLLLK